MACAWRVLQVKICVHVGAASTWRRFEADGTLEDVLNFVRSLPGTPAVAHGHELRLADVTTRPTKPLDVETQVRRRPRERTSPRPCARAPSSLTRARRARAWHAQRPATSTPSRRSAARSSTSACGRRASCAAASSARTRPSTRRCSTSCGCPAPTARDEREAPREIGTRACGWAPAATCGQSAGRGRSSRTCIGIR